MFRVRKRTSSLTSLLPNRGFLNVERCESLSPLNSNGRPEVSRYSADLATKARLPRAFHLKFVSEVLRVQRLK